MKDKNRYTPIAVGAVIALLGVLLGLYFAENARERLAALDNGADAQTAADSTATPESLPCPAPADSIVPLPLEPIDIDVPPLPEEETVEEPAAPQPAPAAEESTATAEAEDTPEEMSEEDDFVEVGPEEEMKQN